MKKFFKNLLCKFPLVTGIIAATFPANVSAQVVHLSENFSTATGMTPPSGWANVTIAGDPSYDKWQFSNPGGRAPAAPIALPAAIFDSDNLSNAGGAENVALETPAINTTGYSSVKLKFDQYFQGIYNGTDAIYVEVYNGTSWNQVYTSASATPFANSQDIDISTHASNRTGVKVRFRFVGDWSWWWIVDNVQVYSPVIDVFPTFVGTATNKACGDAADRISVRVQNNSPNAMSNIPVTVVVTGTTSATYSGTITRSIPVGGTDSIIFPTAFNSINGYNLILKGYTSLGTDLVRANDTMNRTFTILGTPSTPTLTPGTRCGAGSVALGGTAGAAQDSVNWYASASSASSIGTGTTFNTPPISSNTAFYAESRRTGAKDSLVSTYAAGNGQVGVMYNLTASNTVRVDSFAIGMQTTGSTPVSIYYRLGTYAGYELNASAWTLLGSTTITAVLGRNVVPIGGLTMTTGQIYGIFVIVGGTLNYSDGNLATSNSYLSFTSGTGISGTFTGTLFPNRIWNGSVYYSPFCVSNRASAIATVKATAAGSDLVKASSSQSNYLAGTSVQPDNMKAGVQAIYDIKPPAGFTNTDYNTLWTVSSFSVKTASGTAMTSASYTPPGAGLNGQIKLNPTSAETDSTFIVTAAVRLISTSCDSMVSRSMYIAPLPVAGIKYAPACYGAATMFMDSTKLLRGNWSWFWDFGDAGNLDTSNVKNPSYSYSAAGSYTVKLVVTSDLGYQDSTTLTVNVNYLPKTNFGVNGKCLGDSTTFSNLTTISGPPVTIDYFWELDNGSTSTSTNVKTQYPSKGTYTVSLKATTPFGCSATMSKQLTVFQRPFAGFTAATGCHGQAVPFTNTSTVDVGEVLGQNWFFGDGETSVILNPMHPYLNAGTYSVKLVAYSNFGCVDSVTKTLLIRPRPLVNFIQAGVACNEDSVVFNNTTVFSGALTSEWDFGGGTYSIVNGSVVKHKFASIGTYQVRLKATGGGCSDVKTMSLNVLENPIADFSITGKGKGCKNTNISLANASTGPGTLTYSWNFGDNTFSSAALPVKSFSTTGTYQVRMTAISSNGCKDSVVKPITVYDLPLVNYTYSILDPQGRQVQFTPGSVALDKYLWDFGDGNSSSQISPVHSYQSNGPFTPRLTGTDANGCSSEATQTVAFSVSARSVAQSMADFSVYPNPFRTSATISYALSTTNQVMLKVYDMTGRELLTLVNEEKTAGNYKVDFKPEQFNLNTGVYFISLSVDGYVQSKQVIQIK